MDRLIVKFISSLLILMFLISGLSKIFTLGKSESKRLSKKLNINNQIISQMIVLIGGLWEIISCIILLYGIWTLNLTMIILGSLSLVVFTIAATFMFYIFPFKHLPVLSNLTTICGLLLLPFIATD
jgi:uncharacterized membrane protein YphA (DoxX/SURF4 family)